MQGEAPPPEGSTSADRYRRYFEGSLDLHCLAGFDGYFKELNGTWELALGYSREELLSRPFVEFVHPDDREATVREAALLGQGADTVWFENRYRHKDGSYRWLAWTAASDVAGGVIYASARDVTEKKQTEEELLLLQRLSREVSDADDPEEALRVALAEVCTATGWEIGEAWLPNEDDTALVTTPAFYAATSELEGLHLAGESRPMRRGQGAVGTAWASGRPQWVKDAGRNPAFTRREAAAALGIQSGVAIPIMASGKTIAVLAFFMRAEHGREDTHFVDLISTVAAQLGTFIRLKRAENVARASAEAFKELSLRDDLTGLLNRRGFLTVAEHQLATCRRARSDATLLYMDLDRMKDINDSFGHDEGDRALRTAAEGLQATFRETDVIARLGGDEFCVLISGGESAEAAARSRLNAAIDERSRELPYDLSLSIGSAPASADIPQPLDELVTMADANLYEVKNGRSRPRS